MSDDSKELHVVRSSVVIPNLPGHWRMVPQKYDYAAAGTRCPVCGGLGMPWRGWFSCEDCCCVARVDTGDAFVRQEREYEPQEQPK